MCAPVGNELSAASAPMHTIHYEEPHHQSTCISFLLQLSSCFTKSLLVQRKKLSKGLERTYWTTGNEKFSYCKCLAFYLNLITYEKLIITKSFSSAQLHRMWPTADSTQVRFSFLFLEICRNRETSAASQRSGSASNNNLDLVT